VLQCSEDAFVVWVGSKLSRGVYGPRHQVAWVLFIIYIGVVLSDLVCIQLIHITQAVMASMTSPDAGQCHSVVEAVSSSLTMLYGQVTFLLGLALRHGLLKPLKEKLLPRNSASITRAELAVTRWSKYIGPLILLGHTMPFLKAAF
jgi:UPF0716 family protein affecting phage T7 exclusion